MVRKLLASVAAMSLSCAWSFAANSSPPQSTQTATKGDPNTVVCRRQVVTGSLIGSKKVCKTRAEWDQIASTTRDASERMQEQGLIRQCSVPPCS